MFFLFTAALAAPKPVQPSKTGMAEPCHADYAALRPWSPTFTVSEATPLEDHFAVTWTYKAPQACSVQVPVGASRDAIKLTGCMWGGPAVRRSERPPRVPVELAPIEDRIIRLVSKKLGKQRDIEVSYWGRYRTLTITERLPVWYHDEGQRSAGYIARVTLAIDPAGAFLSVVGNASAFSGKICDGRAPRWLVVDPPEQGTRVLNGWDHQVPLPGVVSAALNSLDADWTPAGVEAVAREAARPEQVLHGTVRWAGGSSPYTCTTAAVITGRCEHAFVAEVRGVRLDGTVRVGPAAAGDATSSGRVAVVAELTVRFEGGSPVVRRYASAADVDRGMTTGFPLWKTSSSDPASVPHPDGEWPLDVDLDNLDFVWKRQ